MLWFGRAGLKALHGLCVEKCACKQKRSG
uniref:Uncharacterized protein n=1 Tax=Anguilla anguilla TaxID=7936 RepID=A0A0E9RNW9_ANGAN